MWLAIHDGVITLGVSLYKKMTEAGTQTAEPVVMSHLPGKFFFSKRIPATWAIFCLIPCPGAKMMAEFPGGVEQNFPKLEETAQILKN